MTIWILILLASSLTIGVAYITLGFKANGHLKDSVSNSDRSIGWLFWWSFSNDKYDDEGKKLCVQGQVLALVLIALNSAWYLILLKN